MKPEEQLAHVCLSTLRPRHAIRPVLSQSHGEHDFDIVDDNGRRVGIVEVTSSVNSAYQEALAALDGTKGRQRVPAIQCASGWRVWPRADARMHRVRQRLDGFLFDLESLGLREFDEWSAPAVLDLMAAMGVESGSIEGPSGFHVLNLPGRSARMESSSIAEAIAAEASKADNLRKLSNLDVQERHLFVVVDFSSLGAYCALEQAEASDPASVDTSTTDVWVARRQSGSSAIVLHARNGRAWTRHVVNWRPGEID